MVAIPYCFGSPVGPITDQSHSLDHNLLAAGVRSKIWRGRQVLTVFFVNEEFIYEQKWKSFPGKQLTVEQIMEWAGTWNSSDFQSVLKFEMVPFQQADIRIKFSSKYQTEVANS